MKPKKFGVKDQIGYALGDIGGSFVNLYIGSFFLIFATYVLGVSAYFMGTLFLIARFVDAFTDIIMGQIPDRWKIGKSGDKFLPYISIAKWFLAASILLAFADVSSFNSTVVHIWIVAVYLFYGVAYTADSIPYGSLAAVITQDPIERTKLSRARAIGGLVVGTGAMSLVPMFIYDEAGNVIPEGFFNVAIVFSILCLLAYTGLVKLSTERVRDEDTKNNEIEYRFKDALKAALRNRPLIGMMIASIGSLIVINGVFQLAAIVFDEYYNRPNAFSFNAVIQIAVTLIIFFFLPKLVQKFEKRNLVLITSAFSLVAITLMTLITIENVYLFIVLYNMATIGLMTFIMVVWALVTDCLDYTELQEGRRYDGTIYAIYSFSRKVGMGLGSAIGSYALGWVGFVSGASSQTEQVAENIYRLYTGIPILAFIMILIGVGVVFHLDRQKTDEMYAELESRRA